MILAEETTKYLGDNEGVLNVQLMMKLLQVVAYNLAKSRTARDGNKLKRKKFHSPEGVNVTADSCLGGLAVMTLARNARDWGSIPR